MFCVGLVILSIVALNYLNQSPTRFLKVMSIIFSTLILGVLLTVFFDIGREKNMVAYHKQMTPSVRQNPASWKPGLLYTGFKATRYGGYSGGGYSSGGYSGGK